MFDSFIFTFCSNKQRARVTSGSVGYHAPGEEALGCPSHFKAIRSVNYLVEVTQNFGNDLLHISFIQERHDEAEGRILGEAVV